MTRTLYRYSFENYPSKSAWGKNEEEARHSFQWTFGFWPEGDMEIVDQVDEKDAN
jgi:hypothetical protein